MENVLNLNGRLSELVGKYLSGKRPDNVFGTSLDIANMTGREHRNVLRSIRNIIDDTPSYMLEPNGGLLRFEQSVYINLQNREMPVIHMNQNAFLHVISSFDHEVRGLLIMAYNELLKLLPPRPEQLIRADFTTADLAWEHLQEIAFIKDRLSKAKTQEEIDHWNKLIKEEENKFIEECKKYNLY